MAEVDDAVVLDVLDRVERCGQTLAEAGKPHGLTRSAVAGLCKRVRDALAQIDRHQDPATQPRKPANCDGGMPARWWQDGLANRSAIPARPAKPAHRKKPRFWLGSRYIG